MGKNLLPIANFGDFGPIKGSFPVPFGTAANHAPVDGTAYGDLVAQQCDFINAEGNLKWNALQPGQGSFQFGTADSLVAWAKSKGLGVYGHTLVWHAAQPTWLSVALAAASPDWQGLIDDHFETVLPHTATGIDWLVDVPIWDVVNEAFRSGDGQAGGFRNSNWFQAAGSDYIPYAFEKARAEAPDGVLVLNQNDFEYGAHAANRANLLAAVEGWLAADVPIDAVGIQAHLRGEFGALSATELRETVQALKGMGLQVFISELDVRISTFSGSTWDKERAAAAMLRQFVALMLEEEVDRLAVWGLSYQHWWLSGSETLPGTLYTAAPFRRTPNWRGLAGAVDFFSVNPEIGEAWSDGTTWTDGTGWV